MKPRVALRRGRVVVSVPPQAGVLVLLAACHALSGRASSAASFEGRRPAVILWPKSGKDLKGLAEAFLDQYRTRLNLLKPRGGRRPPPAAAACPPAAALSPERAARIEALLDEARSAPRDPLGISAPWTQQRRR